MPEFIAAVTRRLLPDFLIHFLAGLILVSFSCVSARAQSFRVINYRWEQGFNANTGYLFYRDKKGYIWISTENGLMRFNGHEFKLYTTHDGLPDNEVFGFTEDNQGRMWLLPFANSICYMKQDKIFDTRNDSSINKLESAHQHWHQVFLDKAGTIFLTRPRKIAVILPNGIEKKYVPSSDGKEVVWQNTRKEMMLLCSSRHIYRWKDTGFVQAGQLPPGIGLKLHFRAAIVYDEETGKIYHQDYTTDGKIVFQAIAKTQALKGILASIVTEDNELLIGTNRGAYLIDIKTGQIKNSFLTNYRIGGVLKTEDGTIWLGTLGGGIFRFLNTKIKSLPLGNHLPSVNYIKGIAKGMYALSESSVLIQASYNSGQYVVSCQKVKTREKEKYTPVVYITQNQKKEWLICGMGVRAGSKQILADTICKSVVEDDALHLLIGSVDGFYQIDKEQLKVLGNFMPEQRITCLTKVRNTIYAGTLKGLFACYTDKTYHRILPSDPRLNNHITALGSDCNGTLWVANNKATIIGLHKDRVVAVIDLNKGLQCKRVSCIKASERWIWIGTDNGLFAITTSPPYSIVKHLTNATGLNSNQVNCLDIYDQRVWVGCNKGINYFDEYDLLQKQGNINIIINNLNNGNKALVPTAATVELYNEPLTIDFDIVDFSSSSKPVFEYKLGDSGAWIRLESNHLYFPTLPYGHFSLTIRALGPNWTSGVYFRQMFYHPAPFYRQWWFFLLIGVIIVIITSFVLTIFARTIRKKYKEKLAVQKNLLRLEQMSLQGQMNPHFIFNSIAAIKQYYGSGNVEKAKSFVNSFSLLIRQTFEMGTEAFISLDKELNYLSQYLHIEQVRFNHSFDFKVEKNPVVRAEEILIPTMLLQPLVENAVRHGIRHLPPGQGKIKIQVSQEGENVEIRITDNGIGRKQSNAMKSQSSWKPLTSTTINRKRVELLNRLLGEKLIMNVKDLYGDDMEASGTEVLISYPIKIIELLKNESNHN